VSARDALAAIRTTTLGYAKSAIRTDSERMQAALMAVLDLTSEWGSGMASPLYELGPDVATEIRTAIETALDPR
jgi:hypothetical protein